jgi:hypothetical protein
MTREDLTPFIVSSCIASTPTDEEGLNVALDAVWEISSGDRCFELKRWRGEEVVYEKKFIDLDEAIAAYRDL